MRKGDEYDWILSKIPGWKTYVSIRAYVRAFLYYYRKIRATLVGIPRYLRSNKRYLSLYLALYLALWAVEWLLGLQVEFVILSGWVSCFAVDLYTKFLRPLKKALALSALKRKAFLKKRAFKKQKPSFVVWSTLYVGAGRFLANPLLRISKSKASALFSYLWLAAFVATFLDFILCPALIVWLGYVPRTYPDHERLMGLMVIGVFIDNGLYWNQSHVVNWLLSLATFVALISQTVIIGGQPLSPYIRASFKKLLTTFVIMFLLEVLRVSALDFVLINQLNVHHNDATGTYILLPFLWWVVYLRTFEYKSKRVDRSTAVVFNSLADLSPDRNFHRNTALLRLFINNTLLAVAFAVLCSFYLALKAFSLFVLGFD